MKELIKKIFISIVLVASITFSQLKSLSLDLRNNYSSYFTQQSFGNNRISNYNQNYILSILGYGITPDLMQFDLSTSFTDNFSVVKNSAIIQKQRDQNIGFYNVSATVFPQSTSPLIVYASKADAKNNISYEQQFNEVVASYYAPSFFLYQTDVKGARWSTPKSDFLPSIELGFEKNSSNGKMLNNVIHQTNTNFTGHISNNSANDATRYSLQYNLNDLNDISYNQNSTNHELQFFVTSKLSERLDAFSSAIYMNRRYAITRTMEIGGSFIENHELQHNLRLTTNENSSKINGLNKTVSNSFQHQTQLSLSDRLKLIIGSSGSKEQVITQDFTLNSDRGQAQVQVNQLKDFSFFSFDGTYSLSLGEEKHLYGDRQFVYSTQLGLNATSIEWKTMRLTLRENIDFTHSYVFGNMLNNTIRAEVLTTGIPGTVCQLDGERMDTKSSVYAAVTNKNIYALSGNIKTSLLVNTSIDIQASKSWTHSWYLEETTTSSFSFNQSGFVKNLVLRARGEYSYNSFINVTVLRGEAAAVYQFYAFALQARYLLFLYNRIQTSGFALEVSRPINYIFSQQ